MVQHATYVFFLKVTARAGIYTLSLHGALPLLALASGYAYVRARGALRRADAALAAERDKLAARDSLIATIFSPDVPGAAPAARAAAPSGLPCANATLSGCRLEAVAHPASGPPL